MHRERAEQRVEARCPYFWRYIWRSSLKVVSTLSILSLCALTPRGGQARSFRTAQFPHGNTLRCASCHLNPSGGGALNGFGYDSSLRLVGGNVDWPALCDLDSDEDGFTNAEELGDPDCTWREGDPSSAEAPTAPGDPNSFPRPNLPDMEPPEDMALPIDMMIIPDLAPPIDFTVQEWDAATYDWGEIDLFMTTETPWISPDQAMREIDQELTDEDAQLYDPDMSGSRLRDQAVEVDPDRGQSDEDASIDERSTPAQAKESTSSQSGCQHRDSSRDVGFFILFISLWTLMTKRRRPHS